MAIHYSAMTDRDTVLNLTNHTYFNLAGAGNGNVLDQIAMINADHFTPVDKASIPIGELQSVIGTALDFTQPMAIGARIHSDEAQPENAGLKLARPRLRPARGIRRLDCADRSAAGFSGLARILERQNRRAANAQTPR